MSFFIKPLWNLFFYYKHVTRVAIKFVKFWRIMKIVFGFFRLINNIYKLQCADCCLVKIMVMNEFFNRYLSQCGAHVPWWDRSQECARLPRPHSQHPHLSRCLHRSAAGAPWTARKGIHIMGVLHRSPVMRLEINHSPSPVYPVFIDLATSGMFVIQKWASA